MRKDFLSILGLIALVVVIAGIATAYGGAFAPQVMGHTSDEIKLTIETFASGGCQDFPTGDPTQCIAYCPKPPAGANYEYTVVSGTCQSSEGTNWKMFGAVTITSGPQAGKVGWSCLDLSHIQNTPANPRTYDATVYCLKSGTP